MLKKLPSVSVIGTDDEGLRHYIYERPKVFAMFTSDACPRCELFDVAFTKLADEGQAQAQAIMFVRLDSDENPVARRLMAERAAPFFVSYCQGRMLECGTCETEPELLSHWARLHAFVPPIR
ncbi:MAG TPA: hypothetical protein VF690_07840 [Hymenobacter sp.]|jgi:hypothetical protein